MEYIAIGIDVSKGRADIVFLNQSGTQLTGSGAYDDTHSGHLRLQAAIQEVRHRHPDARLIAGVEATAGYERSWVAFFAREQPQRGKPVAVHRLNPLAVKRFLEADLHRKVDDRNAAHGIARFLLERRRETKTEAIPLDGRVTLYRTIRSLMLQRTAQHQRFHALLAVVQPELVHYCVGGIPDWILAVCRQYPTAERLSRCHLSALANIPHVGTEKAAALRTAALTSTASMNDAGTAITMELLVDDLFALDERIHAGQKRLEALMANDPDVERLDGIPGIARWSAIALVLEIGPVERFADVRQLIAWAGLDPRVDESGDGIITRGISHRGNAHLRAILFPLVLAAMQHHLRIAEFINAKVAQGKPKKVAIVAGAAKLLRIVFALLASKQPYRADHEQRLASERAAARQNTRSAPAPITTEPTPAPPDLTAPVSAKERRRRANAHKKADAQKSQTCEVEPQRDQRATATASLLITT
jgi:transposase